MREIKITELASGLVATVEFSDRVLELRVSSRKFSLSIRTPFLRL
jgi:hypothetical protein